MSSIEQDNRDRKNMRMLDRQRRKKERDPKKKEYCNAAKKRPRSKSNIETGITVLDE